MDFVEPKLNDEQTDAVATTEGFVRVVAGAGSGKTNALAHRFSYLVNELGILPANILCVTFTNKAAAEMRTRIRKLTGGNDGGFICTFHSFCVTVLQEESHVFNYPASFLVIDNADINDMLSIVYAERGLTSRHMTFSRARDMIEIKKLKEIPDYYHTMISFSLEELHQKYLSATRTEDIIFWGYVYQEKKCFALDYNDLIIFVLYVFSIAEDIRDKWQRRLEYIMIDEFQDIDPPQYELMKVLCDYHHNLFIVGDPDQTIYTWRGADVKFLLNFDKQFPHVKTIMMMRNYRSLPPIITAVNTLITKNTERIPKNLIPVLSGGESVLFNYADTNIDEAQWIASEILKLTESGVSYRDIVILYRAHYLSRVIEDVFLKKNIPYTVFSGLPFFERREIKDTLAYLRFLVYQDDLSFRRIINVPKRNIGENRMNFLSEYAIENRCSLYNALIENIEHDLFKNTQAKDFVQFATHFINHCHDSDISVLLNAVLDKSGLERLLRLEGAQERLDNLAELKQAVHAYEVTCGEECSLEHYLSHVALMTTMDTDADDTSAKIRMMTVHSAKGLEFPFVFVCGMNESHFPSKKTSGKAAMEEERRLAFVAFTRAEKRLYLSGYGGVNDGRFFCYPSRFIFDIGEQNLEYVQKLDDHLKQDAAVFIATSERNLSAVDIPDLAIGDRVSHCIFGAGQVLECDSERRACLVKFDTVDTPRKLSVRALKKA